MAKYIPYPAYYDDAPIDLRFVYNDAPAGRHGFLKVQGDKFVFEDGAAGRFWGANFNGGANFPEFGYAEKVARRLAKIGVNIVRFHQMDSEWNTPNIFQFTKGKRLKNTLQFDPESMKRLDYLIYCLKREGIYVYMDIFTYRKFKSGDGVENVLALGDAAKPYSGYDRRMIELQKRTACDFWNHINPYTGLAHKDDPVFAMGEVVNESDLFLWPITAEPYASQLRSRFAGWLAEKGIAYDAANCDLNSGDEPLIDFKIELQEAYYVEMIAYLREIGVKIPLCGTNYSHHSADIKTQLVTDFMDSHYYFYDWKWGEHRCMNRRVTEVPDQGLHRLACHAVEGMPFFVSEWDVPWPNEYRAESVLLNAAAGALQGWSGFTIHTYAYSNRLDRMEILGKEISSGAIDGVAYREGIFSTWNDPAKFGLFYHAALITRRGDVSPAKHTVRVGLGRPGKGLPAAAFTSLAERSRAVLSFNGGDITVDDRPVPESAGEVRADTGELYRSWEKGYGLIDSPRTQAFYGLLAQNGPLATRDVEVEAATDFAVIALSSLSDRPVRESDSLLLTTVGRAKNTDAQFDGERMLDYGRPPILAEVIEAKIRLRTECRDLRVWAVNAEGFYHGVVPAAYEDGCLCFTLGEQFPSVYYLIQAE